MYYEKSILSVFMACPEKISNFNYDDVIIHPKCNDIIKELIFLTGYDYIIMDIISEDNKIFKAGVFPGDYMNVLKIDKGISDGKLCEIIKIVFNVFKEICNSSSMIDCYPDCLKNEVTKGIIERNNIDRIFLNKMHYRLARLKSNGI